LEDEQQVALLMELLMWLIMKFSIISLLFKQLKKLLNTFLVMKTLGNHGAMALVKQVGPGADGIGAAQLEEKFSHLSMDLPIEVCILVSLLQQKKDQKLFGTNSKVMLILLVAVAMLNLHIYSLVIVFLMLMKQDKY